MKGGCGFMGVVNTPTLLGDSTPLMEAASGGYVDIIKLLIEHGAKVNATSRYLVHITLYICNNTCNT